jgi:transposase
MPMKKPAQHFIAEVPRSITKVGMTIGIDLGDVWSHYCTLNEDGEVVDRGRFRTTPSGVEKWFTDLPKARIARDAGNALDLGQRTASGDGPRGNRGEREGAAGDLAQ